MGGYNTSSIGGGQVVTPQQPSRNDQTSYSGYSIGGSDIGQSYGSHVMGGAVRYGRVGFMQ